MRIATILIAIPLFSVAAGTGRVERCNFDLRAPSRQIALHATEGLDTAIEASIRSDGTIPNLSGWRLLLWYGDAATNPPLGVAFTNISLARGVARWDIPGAQIATNGRFAVQIVGQHTSGRSEEWARGWLAIDRNSASSFTAMTFGTPGWALTTNVQAIVAAEAQARASGDLVAMTNWQARVNALTNGAALGATALQPGATNGFIKAEADTLATVTARGGTTTAPVTIGSRGEGTIGAGSFASGDEVVASGIRSHAEGASTTASGAESHSEGNNTTAGGDASHASGFKATTKINDVTAFAWQGSTGAFDEPEYFSHGPGTWNLNPVGGLLGFYIGEETLAATLNASNAVDRAYADAAVNAAPAWIGITNLAAAVTVTNNYERPIYLYATGTVAVSFSGLRTPMPIYLVVRGPSSLTIPGAYYVGGGTFQTNMSNHFVVWKYGTNLMVNAVTATED
jgi:hypothetical protein